MKCQVLSNVFLCLICCVIGIIDIINSFEYYYHALFEKEFLRTFILVFIIAHPLVLLFYFLICTLYLRYLSNGEFEDLTQENEYHEMIYYRDLIKTNKLYIPLLTLFLTVLSYFKFFSFYSLKFLIENKLNSDVVFINVISTTLYANVVIHSIFQSFPQIILQCANNLINMEDKHDLNMRGVVNFNSIISGLFLCLLPILYYREKKMIKIFNESLINVENFKKEEDKAKTRMLELKKDDNI